MYQTIDLIAVLVTMLLTGSELAVGTFVALNLAAPLATRSADEKSDRPLAEIIESLKGDNVEKRRTAAEAIRSFSR